MKLADVNVLRDRREVRLVEMPVAQKFNRSFDALVIEYFLHDRTIGR